MTAIFVAVLALATRAAVAQACTGDGDCVNPNPPCTAVTCILGQCQVQPLDGNNCIPPDDLCAAAGVCSDGRCFRTATINCDDNNPCTVEECLPSLGCRHHTFTCDDGNSCRDEVCDPAVGCIFTPNGTCDENPKSLGYWRHLCQYHPGHDQYFTAWDVYCLRDLCVFSSLEGQWSICQQLETSAQGDACHQAETELLVLALNLCRARLAPSDVARPSCGSETTVGDELAAADAALCDPDRTEATCRHNECSASEITSGQAIGANTLRVTAQGSSQVRLDWDPPFGPAGLAPARLYRVWRRVLPDGPAELLVETTSQHFTDNGADMPFFAYDVTIAR